MFYSAAILLYDTLLYLSINNSEYEQDILYV